MGTEQTEGCVQKIEETLGTGGSVYKIVDKKVTLLIAAGAAMAANCEPCLNKIVADLKEAGVGKNDIRRAVEIGQFVKDKPAANMKQLADKLTGTRLSGGDSSEEADQTSACGCS